MKIYFNIFQFSKVSNYKPSAKDALIKNFLHRIYQFCRILIDIHISDIPSFPTVARRIMPAETKAKPKENILVATILNGDPFLERRPSTFIGIIMHLPGSPVYSYFLNLHVPVLGYMRSLSGYLIIWMSRIPRKVTLTCMIHAAQLCPQLIHRFIAATYRLPWCVTFSWHYELHLSHEMLSLKGTYVGLDRVLIT